MKNKLSVFRFFFVLLFVTLFFSCWDSNESDEQLEKSDDSKFSIDYVKKLDLPVLDIITENGVEPTCDYISPPPGGRGAAITNNKYVKGRLKIYKDRKLAYDSGEYIKNESGIKLKIRGNASAYGEKKPYKIKLNAEADLLFRKDTTENSFADTDWVLLKDARNMNTIVGTKTAELCGIAWTPDFRFVNVFLNGDFKGLYLLGDSVEKGYRRCNVSDEGFIIEDDSYWWKETNYFETEKGLRYTFKYPDKDEVTEEDIEYIKNYVQKVETAIMSSHNYSRLIDEDSWVAWLLTHDILGTWDALGSNIFLAKYDRSNYSKLFMTTPWDFDYNFWVPDEWSRIHSSYFFYYEYLLQYDSFKTTYKKKLYDVEKAELSKRVLSELYDLKNKKGKAINKSRALDAERWDSEATTIENDIAIAETWFENRFKWLNNAVNEL